MSEKPKPLFNHQKVGQAPPVLFIWKCPPYLHGCIHLHVRSELNYDAEVTELSYLLQLKQMRSDGSQKKKTLRKILGSVHGDTKAGNLVKNQGKSLGIESPLHDALQKNLTKNDICKKVSRENKLRYRLRHRLR